MDRQREIFETYLYRYLKEEKRREQRAQFWWKVTVAFLFLSLFLLGFSAGRLSV